MTTAPITLPLARRQVPFGRRLVLSTGLALVTWARRPAARITHQQRALQLDAERAAHEARDRLRYGIAQ